MIPKTIHYCWFGGNPLPESARKCISSWRIFFPNFEIIEWNESNYNVRKVPYIKEAYDAKKYAFVSDYARFDILYEYGGVYFDTDVEVIKPFDDILDKGAFMGCEKDGTFLIEKGGVNTAGNQQIGCCINPGLGIAVAPGLGIYKEILDYYATQHFLMEDGSLNTETVVTRITGILAEHGLQDITGIQKVAGITVYPKEYFNPWNTYTGEMKKTDNTHSIHWYDASWHDKENKIMVEVKRFVRRHFGEDFFIKMRGILKK